MKPTEQVDEEPFQPAVVVGGGGDGNDPEVASELGADVPEVSLQSLLENGAISAEDFAAAVNAASADGRGQGRRRGQDIQFSYHYRVILERLN